MKCDQTLLWTLVNQDSDPNQVSDPLFEHVERCDTCREALAQLGGDPSAWQEASRWLTAESESVGNGACDTRTTESIDLSFLESPSHPEMLGRIGRYEVEAVLGQGGMGIVLRAFDSDLQRTVAVKVLAPQWAASDIARQRFEREAQAAASVAHEHVVPIFNVEASGRLPFLVMRYIPGMTLEQWIRVNGAPDSATILRVAGQLAEGLAAAHRRGLVHRDIKPGNVLVGENIQRIWITDFGLARAADSVTLTHTGLIAGTPHYMSPEQARGEAMDHRSDLFSLGGVLFFLTTGRPPFVADNTLAVLHKIVSQRASPLSTVRSDLPPSFVKLVERMLQRSVDRRPQDCQAVLDELEKAQAEVRRGTVARAPRLKSKSMRFAAATALVVGSLIGLTPVLSKVIWPRAETTRIETSAVSDPWADGTSSEIDPNAVTASKAIGLRDVLDRASFMRELKQIDRVLNQLEKPQRLPARASLGIQDREWSRETVEIHSRLSRLERKDANQ